MNHFAQIKTKLEEKGLDAILLTGEANRFYASAFHTMADEDAVVLAGREKSWFITDSRYIEALEKELKGALPVLRGGKKYTEILRELIDENGIKKLGFESAAMTVDEYGLYSKALGCEMIPASDIMLKLRSSKDEEEIENMVAAQIIAEAALEQILSEIEPGMSEKEIAARLQYLMLSKGAERMSFEPIVASGPNSSMPHAVPTDRKVCDGDFITMDFGCILNGYCSDMTRTVVLGHATEEMKTVYETVLRAQLAGIAAAHAGVKGRDVHEAAHNVIREAGYGEYFNHGFGHSLGIEIHENPSFSEREEGEMPENAVVSAEPGIYLPGKFGVRIEDVVVLKKGGCEIITKAPKELQIIPVA